MSFKKAAAVLSLSVIATVLAVACASAQSGPGSASGTQCVVVNTEGHGSLSTFGLLSRQFSLPWQGAFGSFVATQIARTQSVPVTVHRTAAKR